MPIPLPNLVDVDNHDDPRLAPFRNQKDQWLRSSKRGVGEHGTGALGDLPPDLFIAEGLGLLDRLIESDHAVHSGLVSRHRLDAARTSLARLDPQVPVYVAPRELVEQIVGFDLHRGVLACGQRISPPTADELIARSGLLVILENLANHDNVGSIFRSVRALAGDATRPAVLLSPGCCDPLYRKSLRVSMGQALHVPFATLDDWPKGLARVADAGFDLLAMTPAEGSRDIAEIEPPTRPAVILGAEGPGLTDAALAEIDKLGGSAVRIAIDPAADSLNVGVAAAIALHRLSKVPG